MPLVALALWAAVLPGAAFLPVVPNFDRGRMHGTYFEVATLLQWAEMGCRNTTVAFAPAPEPDTDWVTLTCWRGPLKQTVHGVATPLAAPYPGDPAGRNPARSQVRFQTPLGGEAVQEFHVVLAAADYGWVVVGHPERRVLWILQRHAEVDTATLDAIITRLELEVGYHNVRKSLSCTKQRHADVHRCRAALAERSALDDLFAVDD